MRKPSVLSTLFVFFSLTGCGTASDDALVADEMPMQLAVTASDLPLTDESVIPLANKFARKHVEIPSASKAVVERFGGNLRIHWPKDYAFGVRGSDTYLNIMVDAQTGAVISIWDR